MNTLSPRQRQVLLRLAHGDSNKEIGAALGISEHTVKFHVLDIAKRLGVKTRAAAVVRGLQLGLLQLENIAVPGATP